MNYRQKYKKHYGIVFGPEYEVHHIDFNHRNDDIENLLLLPAELHQRYHHALSEMFGSPALGTTLNGFGVLNTYSGDYAQRVKNLADIILECQKWVRYKDELDARLAYPSLYCTIGGVNK